MLRTFCILLSLQWTWQLELVGAQNIPPIACPNYFQYVNFDGQNVGKITLPIQPGVTRLDLQFSQLEPLRTGFAGELSLFQDDRTTTNNIEHGVPISYRVDFPTPNELPKLIRIDVNGATICSAYPEPGARTTLNLQHMLRTSGTAPLLGAYSPLQPNINIPNNAISNSVQPQPVTFSPNINIPINVVSNIVRPQSVTFSPDPHSTNPFLQSRPPSRPSAPKPAPPQPAAPQPAAPQPAAPQPAVQRPTLVPEVSNAECGVEGSGLSPFVYGGSVITRGQFPWMTAIYQKVSAGLQFICGGTLISSRTVVTAGHCFKLRSLTASQIVAYFGRYNLDNYNEDGVVTQTPQSIIVNPEYDTSRYQDADIALMQFRTPLEFTRFIRPICLWSEPTDVSLIVGQSGLVAGWGEDENGRTVQSLPKSVMANIVSEIDCLRSSSVFKELTSSRTLCAGNRDETGPCHGDSGSGLMLKRGDRWTLRGIVSSGQTKQNKCNLNEFVVYCDVAKHLSWVRSNMLP